MSLISHTVYKLSYKIQVCFSKKIILIILGSVCLCYAMPLLNLHSMARAIVYRCGVAWPMGQAGDQTANVGQ